MTGVACVYAGLAALLLGLAALARPVRRLAPLRTRRRGATVLAAGFALVALGVALPAPERRVAAPRTLLDRYVPAYQFHEYHTLRVAAPPAAVWRAIHEVSAAEIRFFRTLTAIRRLGRRGPESILNAPARRPILDVATRTTFLTLGEAPGRELAIGTVVIAPRGWRRAAAATPEAFRALSAPGFARAAMNFRVAPDGRGGTLVSTETRVHATDPSARRRFAAYWRVIYPGSALIRRGWLRAIARRAEREAPAAAGR
jgi:hypothetical protein